MVFSNYYYYLQRLPRFYSLFEIQRCFKEILLKIAFIEEMRTIGFIEKMKTNFASFIYYVSDKFVLIGIAS